MTTPESPSSQPPANENGNNKNNSTSATATTDNSNPRPGAAEGQQRRPSVSSKRHDPNIPPEFPIGVQAKRELRRELKRSKNPARTIQKFQQTHSLHSMMARAFGTLPNHEKKLRTDARVEEALDTDPALTFLSHLGVSQYSVHRRISDTLLKQLEDAIRKTGKQSKDDTAALLKLLQSCWAYTTTIPELRPVLWSVLRQLGERTPLPVLEALAERETNNNNTAAAAAAAQTTTASGDTAEPNSAAAEASTKSNNNNNRKNTTALRHADIFRPLPPLLKRLVWECDWDKLVPDDENIYFDDPEAFLQRAEGTLLYDTVQPFCDQYCSNEALVSAANQPFVTTVRQRRVLTTQRRALTLQQGSSSIAATNTTTTTATSLLKSSTNNSSSSMSPSKASGNNAAGAAANDSTNNNKTLTSGKAVAHLRKLLCDTSGTASAYRPKLLYALFSILMAQHGRTARRSSNSSRQPQESATMDTLGGAGCLRCTLVADLLLSAGHLSKAYQHVHSLARTLDECVQAGHMSDSALVQIQSSLGIIFQAGQANEENDDNDGMGSPHKKKRRLNDGKSSSKEEEESKHTSNSLKRQLNRIIKASLVEMKNADPQSLFLNPVTDHIAPGYSKIIKQPMCILTMEKKIDAFAYASVAEWEKDVILMFKNCIDYNHGVAGQWFRSEAKRQRHIFREEIIPQARRLYHAELALRTKEVVVEQQKKQAATARAAQQKRKVGEPSGSKVSPLEATSRKRRKEKEEHLPSMPALASMLLADPFVVRLILARVLRDLRASVMVGTSLPVAHAAVPSLLQLLHMARWSSRICAVRGQRFFVPGVGLQAPANNKEKGDSDEAKKPQTIVPYATLRRFLPLLVRLLIEVQLDRRVALGGDLHDASQSSISTPMPLPLAEGSWWGSGTGVALSSSGGDQMQVIVRLVQGALIYVLCQSNEKSLAVTFPKFAMSLQYLSMSLWNDRIFFKSLIVALLRHKSKLPKVTRDAVVKAWLLWLKEGSRVQAKEGGVVLCSSTATACHECFVLLLNEWSELGNVLLPRDLQLQFAADAVEAVNASAKNDSSGLTFQALWNQSSEGDNDFSTFSSVAEREFASVKNQYERMIKQLPADKANDWRERVGIINNKKKRNNTASPQSGNEDDQRTMDTEP